MSYELDYQHGGEYAITAVGTVISFVDSATGKAFEARSIIVVNNGADDILVNFVGSALGGCSCRIESGESMGVSERWDPLNSGRPKIAIVCDAAETATARVFALGNVAIV